MRQVKLRVKTIFKINVTSCPPLIKYNSDLSYIKLHYQKLALHLAMV